MSANQNYKTAYGEADSPELAELLGSSISDSSKVDDTSEAIESRTSIWALLMAFIAILGLFISYVIGADANTPLLHQLISKVLETVSSTVIVSIVVALIFERLLLRYRRRQLLVTVETTVKKTIAKILPLRYRRIRENGILDCVENIDVNEYSRKLENVHNTTIRILAIWVPFISALHRVLLEAVRHRNCTVEIMLWDPSHTEALYKRAAVLPGYEYQRFRDQILFNLSVMAAVYDALPDELRQRFRVRLHSGFIAVSLYGYGQNYFVGLYLNGRLATSGTQIRVGDCSTKFFQNVDEHFSDCWKRAESSELAGNSWDQFRPLSPVHQASKCGIDSAS